MRVTLITHTPDPEKLVATAARLCYSADDIAGTADHLRDVPKMIRQIINSGHHSPLEHASFTFGIEGVSRALLAQITRHRIASFSVQSQRYGDMDGVGVVIPPSIRADSDMHEAWDTLCEHIYNFYHDAVEAGIPREDARFALPNASTTRMIVTMNARELLHFFSLRCCERAQWEIRAVAWRMLELAREIAPVIFESAGPGCIRGACPEGKMSCGHAKRRMDDDAGQSV